MTERDDGGQALPQPVTVGPSDDMYPAYPGMTLRDWFAAHALAVVPPYYLELQTDQRIKIAEWAYGLADAMIAERSK